jgi:hypothetical protein
MEGSILQNDAKEGRRAVQGGVYRGKFMYPKRHPSFFEQPLATKDRTGTFTMEQVLTTYSVSVQVASKEEDSESERKRRFLPSDFYDRSFYMTIEPLPENQSRADRKDRSEPLNQPIDLRALPIQFFHNNTFQAKGVNKILRGRFGTTFYNDKTGEKLWFQVSLFGAGRSMPGSVYSEGIGLTHEDKRTYVGDIEKKGERLFVSGVVTFGSDLGTDARPEPVARFLLTEMKDDVLWKEDFQQDDSVFE